MAQHLEDTQNSSESLYSDLIDKDAANDSVIDLNNLKNKRVNEWTVKERETIL